MTETRTEEQVQAEYIEKMGPELGELFHAIESELTWVHWKWKQYRVLFGENPKRIDLLNEAASFFFYVVQSVLFEDALLGIARLAGPPSSVGKPNLTVKRLCPLLRAQIPPLLREGAVLDEMDDLVARAVKAAEFATDWRHRHIAHRDLGLALKKSVQLPPAASRQQVEDSLSALRDVMNCIERSYCKAESAYSGPTPWDAEALLYVIRDGLLRERDRSERWNRGEVHEDDLKPPEPI